MKYKIYQIKDSTKCDYFLMPWSWSHKNFSMKDYDLVYEGSLEDSTLKFDVDYLEKLFYIFNCDHPKDYKGHSLSVSDVVELENGSKYYCDSTGWQKV